LGLLAANADPPPRGTVGGALLTPAVELTLSSANPNHSWSAALSVEGIHLSKLPPCSAVVHIAMRPRRSHSIIQRRNRRS